MDNYLVLLWLNQSISYLLKAFLEKKISEKSISFYVQVVNKNIFYSTFLLQIQASVIIIYLQFSLKLTGLYSPPIHHELNT